MASTTADRGLVLRRYRYGESSLVVHLLTPRHGRVHLLAKGAYRPRSAYSGVLDLFDTLELGWRRPRNADLGTLVSASLATRRRAVSADLARYRAGLALLELAALAAQPERPDPEAFALVETWLDLLGPGGPDPELALVAFDLRFLQNLGLSPALTGCAACGEAGSSARARAVPFSTAAGGRLCDRCAAEARAAGRRVGSLPLNVLRIAQSLAEAAPGHLARFQVRADALRGVRRFVQRFLDVHLETRPRSRAGEAVR